MKTATLAILFTICLTTSGQDKHTFTDSFMIDSCTFTSRGQNTYFILQPG